MLEDTISTEDARCFYDRLGAAHDLGQRFEREAKGKGLERLDLEPGQSVLNVGVGTGKEQIVIQERILPGGAAYGVDISRTMLNLSRERVAAPGKYLLCEANARNLPFATASFDRIFSSYVLDLIPAAGILPILREMRRTIRGDGMVVLVGLTEGTTLASRALMAAWKTFYQVSPYSMGGCRPLRLTYALFKAGFADVQRDVVVQLGMPSELLVATP